MIDLQPLFGFDVNHDKNGNIEVDVPCNFPQDKKNCQEFYNRMELLKIDESKITFPIMIKDWVVTINPTNNESIMEYYKMEGIKKVVEEQKSKLIGKTTFIKPEIHYPKKAKYPNLIIHFYQLIDEGGVEIYDEYDMIDYCQIFYDNTLQFTEKRIADLEKYVNTEELIRMPFLPIELVRFDESGNIMDFEQHKINTIELPF
jgi:hypothetical protein